MKYFIFSILIFISIQYVYSQEKIFPIGATWYYTKPYSESISCIRLEINKDTIINQDTCKVMDVSEINNSNLEVISHEYLKVNDSKVFYFNQDSFYPLYDFKAKIGDTINVHRSKFKLRTGFLYKYLPDSMDVFRYKVLNVDSIKVGDEWLRRQTIGRIDSWGWEFKNYILENIGAMDYFFGLFPGIIPEWEIPMLRCYSDNELTYTNPDWQKECYYTSGISNLKTKNDILIYPNPTDDFITITLENNAEFEIISSIGKVIDVVKVDSIQKVDVSSYPDGIYFLKYNNSNDVQTFKFIKI